MDRQLPVTFHQNCFQIGVLLFGKLAGHHGVMRKCYFMHDLHSTGKSCKAGLSLCTGTCAAQITLISKLAGLYLNVLAPPICSALISQLPPLLSAGLVTFECLAESRPKYFESLNQQNMHLLQANLTQQAPRRA